MSDDIFAGWDQGFVLSDANAAYDRGDFAAAATLYEKALESAPSDAAVAVRWASSCLLSAQFPAAVRASSRAMELAPQSPEAAVMAAGAAMCTADLGGALAHASRALELQPDSADAVLCAADLLQMTDEGEQAAGLLRAALAAAPDDARLRMALCRHEVPEDELREHAAALESFATHEAAPAPQRSLAGFAAGPVFERLGEHERAFRLFETANALLTPSFSAEQHAARVDAVIAGWTPARIAELAAPAEGTPQPVFIVGMPRTGTTLIEQILSSHPSVFGAGEMQQIPQAAAALMPGELTAAIGAITPAAVSDASTRLRAALAELAGPAERVTDKLPMNDLHLGLIRALFPHAAVVHCVRNPVDTALSCWQHNFRGALAWTNRFDTIAAYYRGHERLMRHWTTACAIPVLRVPYDELVIEPEAWARRIVEHAGLAWDDRCLEPHRNARVALTASVLQVKKKMYRSASGRSAAYGELVDPLRAALAQAGVTGDPV